MRLDLESLPSDIDLLHCLVRDMAAVVETRDDEIGRLQRLIKQLQRTQFGRRSERLGQCHPKRARVNGTTSDPARPVRTISAVRRPMIGPRVTPFTVTAL